MNLLLFASEDELRHIKPSDLRLPHVRQVLRLQKGEQLYAGVINGRRAWATILQDDLALGMFTEPQWEPDLPPQPLPLRLLVGLPRPQTARRVLFEAAVFGVAQLDFFQAQKGEPSYAQSSLWHSDEWQQRLWQGAEQACVTTLPQVRHFASLADALADTSAPADTSALARTAAPANASTPADASTSPDAAVSSPNNQTGAPRRPAADTHPPAAPAVATATKEIRLALDVYEAVAPLSHLLPAAAATERRLVLAIGAERGWSAAERTLLTSHDFLLTHLGQRVLRTETACVAALTLASDRLLHPEST